MFVSSHRKCSIDFQDEEKWKENSTKINTFISCDSLLLETYKRDIRNSGNYLIMKTQTNTEVLNNFVFIISCDKNVGLKIKTKSKEDFLLSSIRYRLFN
jgi:hypothetical protein